MKIRRKKRSNLSWPYVVVSTFFLSYIIVHFAWITPVVQCSCLCPGDNPHWRCSCNSPKCIEGRREFQSRYNLRPDQSSEARVNEGSDFASILDNLKDRGLLNTRQVSLEIFRCDCNSNIKKISIDIKPILLQAAVTVGFPIQIVKLHLDDDWQTPEAMPSQPEVPG